ncbi:AlpA family transcriptional regulator [Rhodoferax sp. U2-2l]|uniref:helix-turn-helix transcriptional regulator n=1 Tax=Rhodoferax sp. U2-2l TaxID=2884000 RepID=UPI001D0A32CA|nr:AlpA family transcriptional regulator [Rhodoferax sp. U2-2l]MCB8747715.1 AlpA family transcriptional regulator [Rhodoferax sp. U2-2l]
MAILRKPELKTEFGWRSDASVSSAVRGGLLTKPVQLGPRSVGWPDYEVKAINTARIAGKSDDDIRGLVGRLHAKRAELTLA